MAARWPGFLAKNELFPAKGVAVVALSNQDGVSLSGPLADQIARIVFAAGPAEAMQDEIGRVREVLEGLQQGRIDRALFTANANSYFDVALNDYRTSLAPLGKLLAVTKRNEQLRGGMTHRSYEAQFEKKSLLLNIYVMPDGRFEQFLVVEHIYGQLRHVLQSKPCGEGRERGGDTPVDRARIRTQMIGTEFQAIGVHARHEGAGCLHEGASKGGVLQGLAQRRRDLVKAGQVEQVPIRHGRELRLGCGHGEGRIGDVDDGKISVVAGGVEDVRVHADLLKKSRTAQRGIW